MDSWSCSLHRVRHGVAEEGGVGHAPEETQLLLPPSCSGGRAQPNSGQTQNALAHIMKLSFKKDYTINQIKMHIMGNG